VALEECHGPVSSTSEQLSKFMPCFMLSNVERAVPDFELPEMVQETFYAMLLNDAIKLGVVSGPMAVDLKLTLEGLRWVSSKS